MASNARIRYLITTLGSVIIMLSGIIGLLVLFISGLAGAAQLMFFNPAGFAVIGSSVLMAIFPVIWIILAYIIYSMARGTHRKDKLANGVIIIILGFIILFMGGGFVIGPVLDIIGGFLLIL
ncbi:hypothetical protein [Ferroplasma sp.]|uniref:hypothetical protein n=1 Tax=Ferroplasma sp. TaxID=2591003 RepID=UPI0026198083|nr:hypothetical protein [Ferroplasma sp.]MCL4453278.1 hypothetical protein [Candidatus Thermoplasmatota archaeon]